VLAKKRAVNVDVSVVNADAAQIYSTLFDCQARRTGKVTIEASLNGSGRDWKVASVSPVVNGDRDSALAQHEASPQTYAAAESQFGTD